jgi:NADPH-dependent 2,4-dienoyl-CoA reductase/sulfur reductase-like enzyme
MNETSTLPAAPHVEAEAHPPAVAAVQTHATGPQDAPSPQGTVPHVVVIGAGFGGLSAVRALRGSPVRITVIDQRNHHLFQPLLY